MQKTEHAISLGICTCVSESTDMAQRHFFVHVNESCSWSNVVTMPRNGSKMQKMAVAASHSLAQGNWAKTDELVEKAIPGLHSACCECVPADVCCCGVCRKPRRVCCMCVYCMRVYSTARATPVLPVIMIHIAGQHFKPHFHG